MRTINYDLRSSYVLEFFILTKWNTNRLGASFIRGRMIQSKKQATMKALITRIDT